MPRKSAKRDADPAQARTRRILGEHVESAVEVLVSLMRDEEQKADLRMKAAESILDRVCGKASATAEPSGSAVPTEVRFEGVLEEWSQ